MDAEHLNTDNVFEVYLKYEDSSRIIKTEHTNLRDGMNRFLRLPFHNTISINIEGCVITLVHGKNKQILAHIRGL